MLNHYAKFGLGAVALTGILALGSGTAGAQGKILRAETGAQGGTAHVLVTVLSKIYKRELGISLQNNDGQTLTRSAIKLGRGQIDVATLPPVVYGYLQKGARMYKKKQHEAAIKAAKNISSLVSFPSIWFHAVTYENSGIKDFMGIKGKRVFTGPPSGGAKVSAEKIIRLVTGYVANKDYKAIHMPWGGGLQAMMDGKLDVYMRPANIGSAQIEQLGLTRKFRLLGVGNLAKREEWKKFTNDPGRVTGIIPAGTYTGQLGKEDVVVGAGIFLLSVRSTLDAELVYKMTKVIWDNLDEIHKSASFLKNIKKDDPFPRMNTKLHPGAIKYYKEKGFKIPARLM